MTETSIHASCVAIGGRGVLITGESGTGKSGLALQLIDQPGFATGGEMMRAQLVADDRICLAQRDGRVEARGVESLAGLLEVRNVGIVRAPFVARVTVDLVVEISGEEKAERMPSSDAMYVVLCGIRVNRLKLHVCDHLAAAKVRAALNELAEGRALGV